MVGFWLKMKVMFSSVVARGYLSDENRHEVSEQGKDRKIYKSIYVLIPEQSVFKVDILRFL